MESSPTHIGEALIQTLRENNYMILTVSLSGHEPVPIHSGRHYLKSLSGEPAEPVDEEEYLHEVEREARKYFCHENFDVTHQLDAVDINLTLQISQVACS